MDIDIIRQQIPVCQRMTYVNTGMSGPSPTPVVEAIKARLDHELYEGPGSPDLRAEGLEIRNQAKQAVARLMNASPDEICLTKNTTEGLNHVMNGIAWQDGDEIVTCSLEHGSVLVPSHFQSLRHGVNVKVLALETDEPRGSILDKIQAALTPRTRLIFLSHIEYSSGLRMPAKEIREIINGRRIMLLLDGAQTAGHIALDMKDLDCDFYSIPGQKWLLGPEGVGALYIRREMIHQVNPIQVAGRATVSDHDPYHIEPVTDTMDKFLMTSTSAALQAGMLAAIGYVQDVGMDEIESRNLDLATSLKQTLAEIPGVTVQSPLGREESSGLVSFSIDGLEPPEAVNRLWERHRIVCRQVAFPSCVRVSLHFFNTQEEVDQIASAVADLA
jgi:selenocysteine lyase/cysteine desulfurase